MKDIPAVIIGAGPVGLSMSLSLARKKIPNILIEQNPGPSDHPRARGVNVRTMELFRRWGIEKDVLRYEQPKEARRFIWAESFQGEEVTRIAVEDDSNLSLSPTQSSLVSQDRVEESLRNALKKYPTARLCFSKEMVGLEQDDSGVTIEVQDKSTQQKESLRAKYLIGADGTRSTTRNLLGIKMHGEKNLGSFCSLYCDVDLSTWLGKRPCIGFFLTDPKLGGRSFFSVDGKRKWIIGMRFQNENSKEDFTNDYCISEIQRVVGMQNLNVKILNKSFWTMGAQLAEQYRKNRVFLIGDAAHQLPPTGGLGMNTGIQDADNLAWKLNCVLKYVSSEELLNSYYEERAPIAKQNMEWSLQNAKRYVEIAEAMKLRDKKLLEIKLQEQHQNLNHLGLDLGFIYHSQMIPSETTQRLSISCDVYAPTTLPGSRAPHVFLIQERKKVSTLDLFENEFVLLVGSEGQNWQRAVDKLEISCPVKTYRIAKDGDLHDPEGNWSKVYEIESSGAVLIRPDGHVSWRSKKMQNQPEEVLREAFRKALYGRYYDV